MSRVARIVVAICLVLSTLRVDAGSPEAGEPSVDLPTDPALAAYLDRIRNALTVRYPGGREAALRCPGGSATVWFSLARDGLLLDRGLVRSSGSILLDRSVLAGLDRTRFPTPPAELVAGRSARRFAIDIDFGKPVCPVAAPTPRVDAKIGCDARDAKGPAFVKRRAPRLTDEARDAWPGGGTVRTRLTADETGSVIQVDVLDTPSPVLTAAVMEAISAWQLDARSACDAEPRTLNQTFVFDATPVVRIVDE